MPNNEQPYHRRRPRQKPRYDRLIGVAVVTVLAICAVVFVFHALLKKETATPTKSTPTSQSQKSAEKSKTSSDTATSEVKKDKNLPDSKATDWDLVLVNRDNPKDELNPDVVQIGNVWVDARIADATERFLTAAQAINPAEHLISGYRSVDYQTTLYNQYVDQEMAADPSLDREAAEKVVQTYSQPPTKSEHQTGLAIDLSDVDSLNESTTAEQVAAIAPDYGFVLRFPEGGAASTGVEHEDWHFRYVGVANAKYMTEHHLTLEDYVKLLDKK
ncbi:D-alanyl-D-alanine carboxypeptidase [Bacilli bacterium]|nr:D-alanyl-D-alanine carboxypeptidase [Bacilli bacterium]GHU45619.1 D-alanyl-D-alanine carboxypeptidase [Bacilli bacterium]